MVKKKACLISGGGSWGAFGGGTLQRINNNYDKVIGVSTGSLLASMTAIKEWEALKFGYTSVTDADIYDKCWFKGKPLNKNGKIRKIPIIMTLLLGQETVCTSNVLRKTIDKFYNEDFFNELQSQNKEVLVGTQNYAQDPSQIHYFSSKNETFENFKDWIWCSACFPFFTSLVKKGWTDTNGNYHVGQWTDGGLSDLVGIKQLNGGYQEVDIVLHRVKPEVVYEGKNVNNLMENITTSINAMRHDIEFEYFYNEITKLNKQGTNVRVFWLPRKLSKNSMIFNQKEMTQWWDEGYETAFDSNRVEIFKPYKKKF